MFQARRGLRNRTVDATGLRSSGELDRMLKSILVPLEGSELAQRALPVADDLPKQVQRG